MGWVVGVPGSVGQQLVLVAASVAVGLGAAGVRPGLDYYRSRSARR